MVELLTKVLRTLTDAKLAEDADPELIGHLEEVIVSYLRAPVDNALAQQQQSGSVPQSMGGMPPGMAAPPMQIGPAAGLPPGRGAMQGPAAPSPEMLDALMRELGPNA
jgi:hypothetical protein